MDGGASGRTLLLQGKLLIGRAVYTAISSPGRLLGGVEYGDVVPLLVPSDQAASLYRTQKMSEQIRDDDLNEFIDIGIDVNNYPSLSPAEERELFKRFREGDEEAGALLFRTKQKLVVERARELTRKGYLLSELFQIGMEGLLDAINEYKRLADYETSAFDKLAIKYINRYIRISGSLHRVKQREAREKLDAEEIAKLVREIRDFFERDEDNSADVTDDIETYRKAFDALLATVPKDAPYEEQAKQFSGLNHAFRQRIADRLAPALNEHIQAMPHETLDQKKELARWVNDQLEPLGLAVQDPKTGLPAKLRGVVGAWPGIGRFSFEVDSDGKRKYPTSSDKLPELTLTDATPSPEAKWQQAVGPKESRRGRGRS